ncbi:MAG: ribosome-associated translation inhibitor RaiA [Clostridia bacterium]|nr:ribosome-associated translation inhibitor RaiA [Clostridia bacterium]
MKIQMNGRKFNITPDIRERTEKKLQKLGKFFDDDAQAEVKFSTLREKIILEVTVKHRGMVYRAEREEEDAAAAVDAIIDVLERQIRKNKTRLEKRLRSGAFEALPALPEEDLSVIRTKRFAVQMMTQEEAALQMEMLGHQFFMFRNGEDAGQINVIYRRKDGRYGLLQPVIE